VAVATHFRVVTDVLKMLHAHNVDYKKLLIRWASMREPSASTLEHRRQVLEPVSKVLEP
jgi:hypothetical protein